MNSFKEIDTPKEVEQTDINDAERPVLRESNIPRWNPDSMTDDTSRGGLSDIYDTILKRYGLMTEPEGREVSDPAEPLENKEHTQYLEEREPGKYYDKETGETYDSVEAWKNMQDTLAKRYDGAADHFEEAANKEWMRFKNAEQSGASEDEKWEHYRQSQESYAKSKECREKAEHIREKVEHSGEETTENSNEKDASDVPEKGSPIQNKVDGLRREAEVRDELEEKYPPEEGYEIISEAYLRDRDGNIVKDPETGKARRIDYVVVKDGKVVDSIEVTSQTADKSDQLAKENRVRENGGNYVRDSKGNLIEIPDSVQTRVERRD